MWLSGRQSDEQSGPSVWTDRTLLWTQSVLVFLFKSDVVVTLLRLMRKKSPGTKLHLTDVNVLYEKDGQTLNRKEKDKHHIQQTVCGGGLVLLLLSSTFLLFFLQWIQGISFHTVYIFTQHADGPDTVSYKKSFCSDWSVFCLPVL